MTNNRRIRKPIELLYIGLTITILASCKVTATKTLSCTNCIKVEKTTINSINGDYSGELWIYIAPFKKSRHADSTATVTLKVKNENCIIATLTKNNDTIAGKTIKGKIKKGYFSVRPKVYPIGIPLIFFIFYSNKIDFSVTVGNELYVAINESKYGNALFFFQGGTDNKFQRVYLKRNE